MRFQVFTWLRIATLSLAAFAAAAFARLRDIGSIASEAEVRRDPYILVASASPWAPVRSADDSLAALDRQLQMVSEDIAALRHSLELMSPLPAQSDFFIPVEPLKLGFEPAPILIAA